MTTSPPRPLRECSREDAEDIRRCLSGDGDAYARIVRRYQDAIARYVWRFTRDATVCEELVQEVFVQAYLDLGRYAGRAPLLHWLKRIATHVGYQHWRRQSRRRHEVDLELAELAATEPAGRDETEEMHRALGALPPRDRLVLTLLYLEEMSVAETASITGWSQTMVKVQAFRARAKLRALLSAQGTQP